MDPALTEERESRTDADAEHIFALVAKAARRASDGQLVMAAAAGIAGAAVIGLLAPSWWFAALPLLCIGSFGVWGIAERTAAEREENGGAEFAGRRTLAAIRVSAAAIGTLAAALAILWLAAMALGTWIS